MTNFDREWRLAELLPDQGLERLGPALAQMLGGDVAVVDAGGGVLWGDPPAGGRREPLVLELEPVGYLVAAAEPPSLRGAARLLEALLRAEARYRMASSLHLEAVAADFEALKQQHAHVLESEARYKTLAESLEQQVKQQVARLEEQQRQLYQAEKLASVGQLAAGVAHEINNPIGFVRSNLSSFRGYLEKFRALKARLDDAPAAWRELGLDFLLDDGDELVRESIAGIDRVARIIRDLKGFSNVDRPDEEVVDLDENLRYVADIARRQLPPGVELHLELAPLPGLMCLPGHLNQVFLNLVNNGMQAVADKGMGGTVTIGSGPVAGGIEVTVRDEGVGMAADLLDRVFEPFFTTRPVGQGTGLGLTVARDIVNAHGGRIRLDSEPGKGTTVTVFLPT
jgi:signal transduction histidine kinase